jgi:hypothetical protein
MNTKSKVARFTLNGSQDMPGNGLSLALECFLKGEKSGDRGRISCAAARRDQTGVTSAGRRRRRIKDAQHGFYLIDTTMHFPNVHAGEVGVLASEAKVMFNVPSILTPQDTTCWGVSGVGVNNDVSEHEASRRRVEVERVGGWRGGRLG